jgi:drug/metabolite transporter (DMT)-like permease
MNLQTKGVYLALITTFVSGFSIFLNKFAVGAIMPPLAFTSVRNAYVGLLIVGLILILGKWRKIREVSKKDSVYLILIGLIGGTLPFYLFFTGITLIPAINAALIHKTLILWVALLAIPLLKERMSRPQIIGIILLFGGNLIVGGFSGFEFSRGELFVLLATMLWAVENIIAKKVLPRVDPDIVTASRMGFGSLVLLGATAIMVPGGLAGAFSLTSTQWIWMMVSVFMLLAYVTSWYRALKIAPATTVASVLVGSTLITNVLSAIFITQTWTMVSTVQAVLIISGIMLFWVAAKRTDAKEAGLSAA